MKLWKKLFMLSGASVGTLSATYGLGKENFEDFKRCVNEFVELKSVTTCNLDTSPDVCEPVTETQNLEIAESKEFKAATSQACSLIKKFKDEVGAPGIIAGVSINGHTTWITGIGFSDLENQVACRPETVMRIASISKSITMAVVGKLWEEKKLDLDKPVQDYVPNFPTKTFDGKEVTITTRMLVSHLSGIRHYKRKEEVNNDVNKKKKKGNDLNEKEVKNNDSVMNKKQEVDNDSKKEVMVNGSIKNKKKIEESNNNKKNVDLNSNMSNEASNSKELKDFTNSQKDKKVRDSQLKEFYIKEHFESVTDSLKLFKDDELWFKPGTSFLYTSHGWTLISAVVESVTKEPFQKTMRNFFNLLGLKNTYLDEHDPIIYNRSRYYKRNTSGRIINAPYVDTSHKWAGGGFLSTVGDLLRFANSMLFCYQQEFKSELQGYLQAETLRSMWTPHPTSKKMEWGREDGYGMAWVVVPYRNEYAKGDVQPFVVGHTGGAVGASSVLIIVPTDDAIHPPHGITVAILTNLQDVPLHTLALNIAEIFLNTRPKKLQLANRPRPESCVAVSA